MASGSAPHDALVVVETFVDDVPLAHLALVAADDFVDVTFHDVEELRAGVVVVVLVAVGGNPFGQLDVPHECVAAHGHAVAGGEVDEAVGAAEVPGVLRGMYGVELHAVLGHDHVEVRGDEPRFVALVEIAFPHGHCHADALAGLRGIFAHGGGVGEVGGIVYEIVGVLNFIDAGEHDIIDII